jgi:hypothetical protein
MDIAFITVEEYQRLLKKLDGIEEIIRDKISPRKEYYTNEDICKIFSISKRTLQNWRDQSLISYIKVNGVIFYTIEHINAFLQHYQIKAKI